METDAYVGKVLDALDHDGLTDNTLVVFASDNGCSQFANLPVLHAHGHDPSAGRRGCKFDIFDGGHRIPSIVRWPGKVAPGTRTDRFVCLGDFMRTCADILHVRLSDQTAEDSISFLPLILGQPDAPWRDTLVESSGNGSFAIRRGPWKLILCPGSGGVSFPQPGSPAIVGLPKFQLYDTVHDPAETTNLVGKHPEIVRELGSALRRYILAGRSTPGAPQANDPTDHWPQIDWIKQFN